jgi:hypothetical protein
LPARLKLIIRWGVRGAIWILEKQPHAKYIRAPVIIESGPAAQHHSGAALQIPHVQKGVTCVGGGAILLVMSACVTENRVADLFPPNLLFPNAPRSCLSPSLTSSAAVARAIAYRHREAVLVPQELCACIGRASAHFYLAIARTTAADEVSDGGRHDGGAFAIISLAGKNPQPTFGHASDHPQ